MYPWPVRDLPPEMVRATRLRDKMQDEGHSSSLEECGASKAQINYEEMNALRKRSSVSIIDNMLQIS